MANASDGGKGNPPDPPNANINPDALPSYTPAVFSAKNDSIPPEIDRVSTIYSTNTPTSRSDLAAGNNRAPIPLRLGTPSSTNTTDALSNSSPAVHRAKNDSIPPELIEF